MKILLLADEECKTLWDYYRPGMFDEYGMILAAGDLRSEYLTFIVTLSNKPVVYVPGNHDTRYAEKPPEGCICADDDLVTVKGIRIAGFGGCAYYNGGKYQYTEKAMERRMAKLKGKIARAGGVDIVLTHAAPKGLGDDTDYCHRGFEAFLRFMDRYQPAYLVHGHVHMNYGQKMERIHHYGKTTIINAFQKYELETDLPRGEETQRADRDVRKALDKVSCFFQNLRELIQEDYSEEVRKKDS